MPNSFATGLTEGLLNGFSKAQQQKSQLETQQKSQDLERWTRMATSPDMPDEDRQYALQQIQSIMQGKKAGAKSGGPLSPVLQQLHKLIGASHKQQGGMTENLPNGQPAPGTAGSQPINQQQPQQAAQPSAPPPQTRAPQQTGNPLAPQIAEKTKALNALPPPPANGQQDPYSFKRQSLTKEIAQLQADENKSDVSIWETQQKNAAALDLYEKEQKISAANEQAKINAQNEGKSTLGLPQSKSAATDEQGNPVFPDAQPWERARPRYQGDGTIKWESAAPTAAQQAKLDRATTMARARTGKSNPSDAEIRQDWDRIEDVESKIQAKKAAPSAPKASAKSEGSAITGESIKPGNPRFKIAQDLAYGKLTFPEFRGIYAYSRDASVREQIYAKAAELNPAFNPSQFEAGFKLASNPKVQQQLASLDNVKAGVEDLLKASDAASRTGATLLNKAIIKGGIAVGGKTYSNFSTARTAFADELSGALGYGSATDMSREMGFDMTNQDLSPENFRSAIQDIVMPFVERKKVALLNQMGVYGKPGMNPAAGPVNGGTQPASQAAPKAPPAVGTVEDGHRFKGGNPADPNSWEKVQ